MTRCAVYIRQSAASDYDLSSCEVQYETCSALLRLHTVRRIGGWISSGSASMTTAFWGQRSMLDRPAPTRLRDAPGDNFMFRHPASFAVFERDADNAVHAGGGLTAFAAPGSIVGA